jgi:hypothetical protein
MFTVAEQKLNADALETWTRLAELNNDAEEVVGAIGVAGIAKGYSDTAEAEQKVANARRYATVAVAVVAAVVLGWALFIDHTGEASWQRLVTRLVGPGLTRGSIKCMPTMKPGTNSFVPGFVVGSEPAGKPDAGRLWSATGDSRFAGG